MNRRILVAFLLTAAMLVSAFATAAAETVTASAKGFGGDVTVEVDFEGSAIAAVRIQGSEETAGIGSRAIDQWSLYYDTVSYTKSVFETSLDWLRETSSDTEIVWRSC